MLACYPFLSLDGNFSSVLLLYDEIMQEQKEKKEFNPRFDEQWGKLKSKENPYDFLLNGGIKNEN